MATTAPSTTAALMEVGALAILSISCSMCAVLDRVVCREGDLEVHDRRDPGGAGGGLLRLLQLDVVEEEADVLHREVFDLGVGAHQLHAGAGRFALLLHQAPHPL